jgi:hypothetical protein
MVIMTSERIAKAMAKATAPPTWRGRVIRGSPTAPVWAIENRLANAERELRVQFTRIAQLQAELDLVLAALRRQQPPGDLARFRSTATRFCGISRAKRR